MSNPYFNPTFSSNEVWYNQDTNTCLTDVVDGKAEANHSHTGYAASNHGHSYNDLTDKPAIPTVPASLPANGGNADTVDNKHASDFAAADHTHQAVAITAHLSNNYYALTTSNAYETIPLNSTVVAGSGLSLVNNKVCVGAGISKVKISAQACVGTGSLANKYLAIRVNGSTVKARAQIRPNEYTTPETVAIPGLIVSVSEGDLISLDFSGAANDAIYGDNVLTFLTVQKLA